MIEDKTLASRIGRIESLIRGTKPDSPQLYEAVMVAQTVLQDTAGTRHPLMETLTATVESYSSVKMIAENGDGQ